MISAALRGAAMRYPSMAEIEDMPDRDLAQAVLHHLKHVTLPRVRGEFNIQEMNAAHKMIEGLEAWIGDPQVVEEQGKRSEFRNACTIYAASNFPG